MAGILSRELLNQNNKAMKTAEELLIEYGRGDVPFDENVTMCYPAIISAMEEYASQFKPQWVSVEERLPEIDQEIVGISESGKTASGKWSKDYHKDGSIATVYGHLTSIKRWMPLPTE